MSNLVSKARTNYFSVKDLDLFQVWAEGLDLHVFTDEEKHPGKVAFWSDTPSGDWPSERANPEDEEADNIEIDFLGELAAHLAEGEVAVLIDIGSENMQYLWGSGNMVTSDGIRDYVDIESEIMTKARRFNSDVTSPIY